MESEILAIDGVMLRDFDYIDLGRIRMPSYTVPVTIKSLVFSENPTAAKPQRIHHHAEDHDHSHGHDHAHGTAMATIITITIMARTATSTRPARASNRD